MKRPPSIRRLRANRSYQHYLQGLLADTAHLSEWLEPWKREVLDPGIEHAVTISNRDEWPNGRAICTCGTDTGWLPLWDAEQRGNWHRREAEKLTSPGSDRVGDREVRAVGEHGGTPMFDRTLFTTLARRTTNPEIVRTPPVVPLPVIDDRPPVLLIFDQQDLAVELAYERYPKPGGTRVRSVARDSQLYGISRLTPVLAVSEGVVVYARKHTDGHTIIIDHCNNWLTVYHRLEHMFVAPSERVPRHETRIAAGDVLGYLAPSRPGPLEPLRFEMWKRDSQDEYQQMDPLRYIRRWRYLDWSDPRAVGVRP